MPNLIPSRVLYIEDDAAQGTLLKELLKETTLGVCVIDSAGRLSEGMERLKNARYDLILLDLGLPDSQGFETFTRVKAGAGHTPIIVLSGMDDEKVALRALHEGAEDYIVKSRVDYSTMWRTICHAIERGRVQQELVEKHALLHSVMNSIPDQVYVKDTNSRFVSVNPVVTRFLGASSPDEIVGKSDFDFFPRELATQFLEEERALLRQDQPCVNRESASTDSAGNTRWVWTTKVPLRDHTGNVAGLLGVNRDITLRKQVEAYHDMDREIMQIFSGSGELRDSLQIIIAKLKTQTECDAVGFRLQEGDDFPYFIQDGFSKDFLMTENTLIERGVDGGGCRDCDGKIQLECTCGLVISGKADPSSSFFTKGGSFWTNDSFPLLNLPTDQDLRRHPRNVCVHHGYGSVALIPIRTKDRIIGLLQLNARKKGRFTLAAIELLEIIAQHVGEGLLRKQAEEKLQESEARLRDVVLTVADWVWETDENGVYTYSSQLGVDYFGHVIGKTPFDFMPADEVKRTAAIFSNFKANKAPIKDLENWNIRKNGERICFLTNAVPILDGAGNLRGYRGVDKDITKRKLAELEMANTLLRQQGVNHLQQSLLAPSQLEDKLKMITDGIVRLFDADFCRIWLIRPGDMCERGCVHAKMKEEPHVCRHRDKCLTLVASSGRYTHIDGKGHSRIPFDCYKIGRIASGKAHTFASNDVQNDPRVHDQQWTRELGLVSFAGYQLRVPNGEILGVLALFSKHPILTIEEAMLDELSNTCAFVIQQAAADEALKIAQMQLIEVAKLESVGQLAAGVAHEVKNPLAIALMGLEYLSSTVAIKSGEEAMALKDTKEAILRADNIIRELLLFSMPATLERKLQDLNAIVERAAYLVHHEARKRRITTKNDLAQDLPHIQLDDIKIEQVLVNLCMNAIDAMSEGGVLLIRTRANQREIGFAEVVVDVEDTGPGIPAESLEKVFDPFFTRKPKGKGTGLGLTVARRIIDMHKGKIAISNRPEGGTRATITFKLEENKL